MREGGRKGKIGKEKGGSMIQGRGAGRDGGENIHRKRENKGKGKEERSKSKRNKKRKGMKKGY